MSSGISLSQGDGGRFLETVEVHGDAEWDGHLVCPGVSLTNGARAVVHTMGDVVHGELLADPLHEGGEIGVIRQGE